MLSSILRLLALRPFFGMAILGVPVLALLAIGLFAVAAFKVIIVVVVPLLLLLGMIWIFRRLSRR